MINLILYLKHMVFERSLEDRDRVPKRRRQREISPCQEQRVVQIRKRYLRWGKEKLAIIYQKTFQEKISKWKIQKIFDLCDGVHTMGEIYKQLNSAVGKEEYSLEEVLKAGQILVDQKILGLAGYSPMETLKKRMINAWIHVTNDCNMSCDYCYIEKNGQKMTKETARQVVESLYRTASRHPEYLGIKYVLAGGEPLTNLPIVEELLSYSLSKSEETNIQHRVGIITNGTILNDHILKLIRQYNCYVSVSLDGLGTYNRKRHYKNGEATVKDILKNLNDLKRIGTRLFVLITITKDNINGLPQITEYLLEHQIGFRYSLYRDLKNGNHIGAMSEQLIRVLERCYNLIEKKMPSTPLRIYHKFADTCITHPIHRACGINQNSVRISYDGKVYLCQTDIARRLPIGHLNEGDLLQCVQSQTVFPDLTKYPSVEMYEKCSECEWHFQCGGGCPLLTKLAYGRVNIPSPYCEVYQWAIPRLIELTGLQLIHFKKEKEVVEYG